MIFSGVATILMGLVPYFSSFVLFFASFFILRIIQSIGYGGEIPNAVTILYEYDRNKKFLHTANVIFNATLGAIFAFATVYVISNIDKKYEMDKFLWRVPLIVSGVLTLVLFFLRTNHSNFLGRKKEEVGQINMFMKIIKSKIHLIFIGILMILPMAILNINNIFLPTYLSQHFAYNKSDITLIITMGLVFSLFCTISSGILLDKFNYKKLYPLVTSVLVSYIIYIVSYSGFKSFVTVILFNLIYNMYISFVIVMSLGLLSDLLSKEVRNTAIGFVYNVSFVIASLVPSISIELFKEFGEPLLIYYCFLFVIFISFISTMVYLNNYNENR